MLAALPIRYMDEKMVHNIRQQENSNKNHKEILSLEWSKSGTLTTPNFGECVEQPKFSFIGRK